MIFDAPCLFYIFSGTNLLTSCHSASCLISSVFGSRKAENQYSRNWTGQNPKSIFYREGHESRDETETQTREARPPYVRVGPAPRLGRVWGPWLPPSLAFSPMRSP